MIDDLRTCIERELDVGEMVLTDPLTLRKMKADRILRAILTRLREPSEAMLKAGSFQRFETDWDGEDNAREVWEDMIAAIAEQGR